MNTLRPCAVPRRALMRLGILAFAWPVIGPEVIAQGVVPRSPGQLEAPGASLLADQERSTLSRTPGSLFYLDPASFLRWGPFVARPHFNAGFAYSSGLRSRLGTGESVYSQTYSPGILIEMGQKWFFDYTPSLTYYSSKNFKDNLAHSVSLSGGATYGDWAFSLSQSYSTSSSSLLETGRQTDQENFGTGIGISRHLNSKLMLELGFNQSIRSAEALTSSRAWSTTDWLNYQVAQRISIGAGIGGGYEDVNVGNDMIYESLQARLDVRIAQKLNVTVNGGGEVRQIVGSDAGSLINPIYGLSAIYHPFTYTTVALSGNRTVSASLLAGQITEATDISLSVSQRFLGRLFSSVATSFRNTSFVAASTGDTLDRTDDSVTFSASIGTGFLRRGSVSLAYSQTENMSSDPLFSLSSHQVSLNLGYRF